DGIAGAEDVVASVRRHRASPSQLERGGLDAGVERVVDACRILAVRPPPRKRVPNAPHERLAGTSVGIEKTLDVGQREGEERDAGQIALCDRVHVDLPRVGAAEEEGQESGRAARCHRTAFYCFCAPASAAWAGTSRAAS